MKRIVILGAGYGGMLTAKKLHKYFKRVKLKASKLKKIRKIFSKKLYHQLLKMLFRMI